MAKCNASLKRGRGDFSRPLEREAKASPTQRPRESEALRPNMWANDMSFYVRKKGMTFALEPKTVFPGEGSVGIENTVAVTEKGYEILTPVAQNIFQV